MGFWSKVKGVFGRIGKGALNVGRGLLNTTKKVVGMVGAPVGAAVGSIIPGVGTAAGGALGGALQGLARIIPDV